MLAGSTAGRSIAYAAVVALVVGLLAQAAPGDRRVGPRDASVPRVAALAVPAGGAAVGSPERRVRKKCRAKRPRATRPRACRKPRAVRPAVRPTTPPTPVASVPVVPVPVVPVSGAPAPAPVRGPMVYTLVRKAAPSPDELDAYARITAAMDAAVARYNRHASFARHLRVSYVPGVPTAEGGGNDIRFGTNRAFMNERTALHEIGHTVGVGISAGWYRACGGNGSGTWSGPVAGALVRRWDGPGAVINCGGRHIWPYGLNYDREFSQLNADRHVQLMAAMVRDGQ